METLRESKRALRAAVLARCRTLPAAEREAAERALHERVRACSEFRSASRLALFAGTLSGEVATRPLFDAARAAGAEVALPRVLGDALSFALAARWEDLRPGPLGVPEPPADAPEAPSPALALIPGVAYDLCGGRLGRGRGYYDRWLATLPADVPRIGLAFECQLVDAVPCGPDDRPVDAIFTEARAHWVEAGRS